MTRHFTATLFIKTLLFVVIVPATVLIRFPYLLLSIEPDIFSLHLGIFRLLGIFPVLLGAIILLWCWRDFLVSGKGTPSPTDPPACLVITGLYHAARNPMYVGVAFTLFGEAMLFESLLLLLYDMLMVFIFHLFICFYEEPVLTRKFGETYTNYCQIVPRWIPCRKGIQPRIR